jgi:hypothetical protein
MLLVLSLLRLQRQQSGLMTSLSSSRQIDGLFDDVVVDKRGNGDCY